jgi:hypothetical protein
VPSALARRAAAMAQVAAMAAIVATLCYWPVGIAAALVLGGLGVPLDAWLTFGGAFNRYAGMALWWLVVFAPALVYAAFVFPWDETRGFPPPPGR